MNSRAFLFALVNFHQSAFLLFCFPTSHQNAEIFFQMYTLYISKWICSSHIDHGICFRKDTVNHPPEMLCMTWLLIPLCSSSEVTFSFKKIRFTYYEQLLDVHCFPFILLRTQPMLSIQSSLFLFRTNITYITESPHLIFGRSFKNLSLFRTFLSQ